MHERHRRRRLVVLAAIALILLGTASAFGVRALILDKGFIGLPPEGATPSTPEGGELVVSYEGPVRGDWGLSWWWLYADGRLISWREANLPEGANRFYSGLLQQRLTAERAEQLRAAIVSAAGPGGSTLPYYTALIVRDGDRLVNVEQIDGRQIKVGIRLMELGTDLAVTAYVPSRYVACYGIESPDEPVEPSRALTGLPSTAKRLLREKPTAQEVWVTPAPR